MSGPGEKESEADTDFERSNSGTLVSRTNFPAAAPVTTQTRPPRLRERPPPTKIGRYEVDGLLGQGGMGRVWLARDTVLGRKVAIKVLRDDLSLPPPVYDELVTRMSHEARAAAAVSHPNIVVLHDMGEDETLGLFLVFEYVTTRAEVIGPETEVVLSLRDRLREGPLTFAEVAKLAREVGSALTFAHEAGVIHRDVKPENILFSRTGFKIADFGIARIPDSTITRTNTILGTPAYTAPEALSKGEFSPASDQFSLATTLYEAATGTRAFAGDDAIATAGKVSSEPPPPIEESIGDGPVVRTLDQALRRGLAKTPEERFASCAELGQAVARALERGSFGDPPRGPAGVGQWPSPLITPAPTRTTLERTPLSSRARLGQPSLLASISSGSDTPRPSLFARERMQRFQNIAAGVAIVVLVILVVLGRRNPSGEGANAASAARGSASTSATPPAPSNAPASTPKRARPHLSPHAAASGSAISDASAPSPIEAGE